MEITARSPGPRPNCASLFAHITSFQVFLPLLLTFTVGSISLPLHTYAGPTSTHSRGSDLSHGANISVTANVGMNDSVLISGFVVRGSQPKRMILRAIGPSLTSDGVVGALADPTLELYDATGATIATNDNWQMDAQANEISASGMAPKNPLESALLVTLQPGNYIAIVRGANNMTGTARLEGYELDSSPTHLVDLSTRGQVGQGDQVLSADFTVSGSESQDLLVRALGPSLTGAGINGAVAHPAIEVHNSSGEIIAANDNWQSSTEASSIKATGMQPTSEMEAAVLVTLNPGSYTAVVHGSDNATGIGQMDVHQVKSNSKSSKGKKSKKPTLGLGIMYLTASDGIGDPIHDLSGDPEWTNPLVQGVALRTQWGRVEPAEGSYYWGFLDQGVALAKTYGKKVSILVTAGVTTPQWVFDAGATEFDVTEQVGSVSPMPVPWDKTFQAKWSDFLQAFSARYGTNPNLVYVVMGGFGRRAESFFVTTDEDQAALDALAVSQGYTNGLAAWQSGAEWVIDQYSKRFPKVPFILDLGSPYPTDAGNTTLQTVCNYGAAKYAKRFAVKSDGLAADGPPTNSIGATEVALLSPTSLVGYQMGLPQKDAVDSNGNLTLSDALTRGIGFGAHFVEVYSGDCDDPVEASALSVSTTEMLAQ
ncbi:MAG TPA: DVUA0089 family protein [Terriglobales bacterium]|nr:DVUA0089 family protein [Terriglobales bacterium]